MTRIGNRIVGAVLQSPLHRLLSGSTALIRYTGRRSGRTITTPVRFAAHRDKIVIFVGNPRSKTWWRNFRQDHELDILVRGRWSAMTGRAVVGADDPEAIAPLLVAYLARFPRVASRLEPDRGASSAAVIVLCRSDAPPQPPRR